MLKSAHKNSWFCQWARFLMLFIVKFSPHKFLWLKHFSNFTEGIQYNVGVILQKNLRLVSKCLLGNLLIPNLEKGSRYGCSDPAISWKFLERDGTKLYQENLESRQIHENFFKILEKFWNLKLVHNVILQQRVTITFWCHF